MTAMYVVIALLAGIGVGALVWAADYAIEQTIQARAALYRQATAGLKGRPVDAAEDAKRAADRLGYRQ